MCVVSNGASGVVIPLGRTWRIVGAPNLSFETEVGALKLRVRGEVNVNSVGFDGEGVASYFKRDVDAEGVFVGRWVMLGELTREGYVTESEGVEGSATGFADLRAGILEGDGVILRS